MSRDQNLTDIDDGRHTDAAFADNPLLIGFSRRFLPQPSSEKFRRSDAT